MSNLLFDDQPLVILPQLALAIGLNESIVVQQLHYWLKKSENVHDGYKWVYNHSHQVKNLIFFQRQKHGILSNENHRWKGLFFDGKKDEGMDNNDSSTLLL